MAEPNREDENPLSAKNIHRADQSLTFMIDYLPRAWKGLYDGCLANGFSEQQAFTILLCYIGSSTRAGT